MMRKRKIHGNERSMMEQTLGCEYMSHNSHMSAIFGAQHISAQQDKCSTIQHDGDMLKALTKINYC
jgi:hypothetical protein